MSDQKKGTDFKTILLVLVILALAGVSYVLLQKSNQVTVLTGDNAELTAERDSLDVTLNDFTSMVNEVSTRLQAIRNNQVTITELIERTDSMVPDARSEVLDDINAIENQLDQDKRELNELVQKMEQANIRIRSLENMVASLRKELDMNVQTVTELRAVVESKNEVIAQQETTIRETQNTLTSVRTDLTNTARQLQETRTTLTETQNTAYYVIGEKGDLKDEGLLIERGFIFRKSLMLAPELNDAAFTKIDISRVRQVNIDGNADDIRIVPARGDSSYTVEESGEDTAILRITDPDTFWKIRYLAIVID